jgi:prephenate dehydrogenase
LAQTVLKKEKNEKAIFDLAAGGFESTVRLAKSAPSTWAPIFAQNRQHVLEAVEAYLQHLTQFRDDLKNQKDEALVDFMQQAGDIRRVLLQINNNKNNSTGV